MIFSKGRLVPSREQLEELHKQADESFCARSTQQFNQPATIPRLDGHVYCGDAVLLRLRNVEPHDDPWVSEGKDPRVRRAIFWLMSGNKSKDTRYNQLKCDSVWFGCGPKQTRMEVGDWVLFDDSKKHWVMSDHIWRGASWQLRRSK